MVYSSQSGAIAAVKSGLACPKFGSTQINLGKVFTCIKSGKKLIWDKGLPAAKPVQNDSQGGTSNNSSTPPKVENDSVDITQNIVYRYMNSVLERKATKTGIYYSTDSRKDSNFDPIRMKAYESIRAGLNTGSHPNLTFYWDVKPSFSKEVANFSKDYVEVVASYWGPLFKEPINIPSQLVTEQDIDFEKSQELRFSDTLDILNRFTTEDFKRQIPWVGGGAHFWQTGPNASINVALLNFQMPSYAITSNLDGKWVMIPSHEVFHLVQDYYLKGLQTPDEQAFDQRVNQTFREGTASLFGGALDLNNIGWYSDFMDAYLYEQVKNPNWWFPIKTEEDVIKLLTATETRKDEASHQTSYSVGAVLYEWVIAKYGMDGFMKILQNMQYNPDFSDTIKSALGISKLDLYRQAAPYILGVITRIKAN
jgi:hypothetical protein